MSTYYVDGAPVEWRNLIRLAKSVDPLFGCDGLSTTSGAAAVLRDHGHYVSDTPPTNDPACDYLGPEPGRYVEEDER